MSGHATTVTRASAATKLAADGQSILDAASGEARYEKVAAAGALAVTARGAYIPLAVDPTRDWLLVNSLAAADEMWALKPGAIDTPVKVADFSAASGYVAGSSVNSMRVTPNGWWWAWVGLLAAEDGNPHAVLFLSKDAGVTWTAVHTITHGPAVTPHSSDVLGTALAYGTYITDGLAMGYAVYLTRDYTATPVVWETVYEVASPAATKRHVHSLYFEDADAILTLWGDASAVLMRHTYAAEAWSTDDDYDVVFPLAAGGNEGMYPISTGEYIICSRQNLAWDPATNVLRRFGPDLPRPYETGNCPYGWTAARDQRVCLDVKQHAGITYAAVYNYTDPAVNGYEGVHVSPDGGAHWVQPYQIPATRGVRNMTGPWQGEWWLYAVDHDGVGSMISFPPVRAALVDALRLEAGATNAMQNDDSASFEASVGNWEKSSAHVTLSRNADAGVHGGACLQVDVAANASASAAAYAGTAAIPAASGSKCVISAWVKFAAPHPRGYGCRLSLVKNSGAGAVGKSAGEPASVVGMEGEWYRVRQEVAITGGDITLWPWLDVYRDSGDPAACTVYLDAVQVVVSATRHFEASSFALPGEARADESASVSLAGCAGAENDYQWTLLFAWRPESGWADYGADVPILSLDGGGGVWVDLSYQVSTSRFLLKCGETEYSSGVVQFRHPGTIRFALSTSEDGEDLQLFLWDPVSGAEEVGAEGLGLPNPASARFGRDNTGAIFGAGLFHSLGIRRAELSAAEFLDLCARPGWSWNRPLSELALTDVES